MCGSWYWRCGWHDGQHVIMEETLGVMPAERWYVCRVGIDEVLVDLEEGVWYLDDALGSVYALTDGVGEVVEAYQYDIYGQPRFYDGAGQRIERSQYGNVFMFTGRYWEGPLLHLYYYRARYYSPRLGRFLQRDPAEIAHISFAYTYNSPTVFIDPTGACVEVCIASQCLGMGALGHAAMRVGNKVYATGLQSLWDLWKAIPVLNLFVSVPRIEMTYSELVELYVYGEQRDLYCFVLEDEEHFDLEDAARYEWARFRSTYYDIMFKNCATSVAEVLRAINFYAALRGIQTPAKIFRDLLKDLTTKKGPGMVKGLKIYVPEKWEEAWDSAIQSEMKYFRAWTRKLRQERLLSLIREVRKRLRDPALWWEEKLLAAPLEPLPPQIPRSEALTAPVAAGIPPLVPLRY